MSVCDAKGTDARNDIKSFNPCFNGCRSAICDDNTHLFFSLVSILVLMDVGLRSLQSLSILYTAYSFNPCFNGCRSAIRKYCRHLRTMDVSILVLMDVGLR